MDQSCIHRLVRVARIEVDLTGDTGRRVRVAVDRVDGIAHRVGGREERPRRRDKLDLVVTRLQASELVIALLNRERAEVVASGGRGDDVVHGVEQIDDDTVDAGLAHVLLAVAVRIRPDEVAELRALQLDDQRLDVARGVDDLGEERVGGHLVDAAGDGQLRVCDKEADVSGVDHVAVVVAEKQTDARGGNLRVGKTEQFPDRDLYFAEVELTAELWIRGEVLGEQPIELVDLIHCDRAQADGLKRGDGVAGGFVRHVREGRRKADIKRRVQAVGVVDAVGQIWIRAACYVQVQEARRAQVWLLSIVCTQGIRGRRPDADH